MASDGQQGSRQVRSVIELLCTILEENNITTIRAETLRQAKFNKDGCTREMWNLVSDIVYYCSNHKMFKLKLNKLETFSGSSRQLLLVLGWLIHKTNLIEDIIYTRSNPLDVELLQDERFAPSRDEKVAPSRDLLPHEKMGQHLLLCGKLRLAWRRLYGLQQELAILTNKIAQHTAGLSLQVGWDHLTAAQVYLLKNPDRLLQLLVDLEAEMRSLQHLLEWKEKKSVFWHWMASVLELEQRSTGPDAGQIAENLGQDISTARSKVRELILNHEPDMNRLEQLIPLKRSTSIGWVEQVDLELLGLTQLLSHSAVPCQLSHSAVPCPHQLSHSAVPCPQQLSHSAVPCPNQLSHSAVPCPQQTSGQVQNTALQEEMLKQAALVGNLQVQLQKCQVEKIEEIGAFLQMYPDVICIQARK
ncbi:tubulin epsilon and delta complex protein 1-like isoform X2 [Physella acuta]|uniref:tubulin epsilon and delta complex protein 1-like isoform X2 n=1 Tax=Physella acuta TaxID=109671 RepID=UPI0027DBEBEC|nr:tubulin epsilon and delta complex protein 1-like isoform X2 [Physella acuta]